MAKRLATLALTAAVTVLAAACASDHRERWQVEGIPDGSRLVVEERLRVSGFSGRVYVQDGEVVGRQPQVNRYAPNCSFRLRSPHDQRPDSIEPGTFEVDGYRTWRSVVGKDLREPLALAAREGHGTPSFVRHHTRVELHSAEQPEVDEMVCQYASDGRAPHLQYEQIQETLAGVARLEQ